MQWGEVSTPPMLQSSERSLFFVYCNHVIGSKGLFSRHTWVAKLQKSYSFCNYSCNFGLQKWPRNHEKLAGTIVYTVITDHDTDHMYQFLCRFYNLGCKTNVTQVVMAVRDPLPGLQSNKVTYVDEGQTLAWNSQFYYVISRPTSHDPDLCWLCVSQCRQLRSWMAQ